MFPFLLLVFEVAHFPRNFFAIIVYTLIAISIKIECQDLHHLLDVTIVATSLLGNLYLCKLQSL